MNIRYMTLEDIDDIVSIENKVWTAETTPAPLPISDANKILEKFESNTHYLIAEDETSHEILGVLDFHPYYSFESGKHVVTFSIAVDPDNQKEGVGKALMDYFFEEAKTKDFQKVTIHVLANNQQAIAFYQSFHFSEEGRVTNAFLINGDYVDDLVLSLSLEDGNA